MWCCCCTPKEELVQKWEAQMSDIISNVKRARSLGVRYVEKLRFDRQSEKVESEIVECFTNADQGLVNAKLTAIQYLLSSSTLQNQCKEQLEFYRFYARKQLDIFNLSEKIEQLELDNHMLKAENSMLKNQCSILQQQSGGYRVNVSKTGSKNAVPDENGCEEVPYENEEINRAILLTRQQYEKMPKKTKEMRANLEQLIASYDAELKILKYKNGSTSTQSAEPEEQHFPPNEEETSSPENGAYSWSMQEQENRSLLKIQPGASQVRNKYHKTSKKSTMSKPLDFFAKSRSESKYFKCSSNIELQSLKNAEEDEELQRRRSDTTMPKL